MVSGNNVSQETLQYFLNQLQVIESNAPSNPGILQELNSEACTIPEQLGMSFASVQIPVQLSHSVVQQRGPSSLPASENWPGQFNFHVSFPTQENIRGVSWIFSNLKNKLYVGKDVSCPVNFSTYASVPDGVFIRAMSLFTSPDQASEVVHRCVNHSMDELLRAVPEAEHLIRCESDLATYHIHPSTGHHSVVLPFEKPSVGQQYSTYLYKFACFGSCAGGPNRRPMMLVFTLERGNEVIGRCKVDLKICACPGRDKRQEEELISIAEKSKQVKRKTTDSPLNATDLTLSKKRKSEGKNSGGFTIKVEDEGCYKFLKQMKKLYEIRQVLKKSQMLHVYFSSEDDCE